MVTAITSVLALVLLAGSGQRPDATAVMARTEVKAPPVVVATAQPTDDREEAEALARDEDARLSTRLLDRVMKAGHLKNSCLAIAASDRSVRLEGTIRTKEDRDAIERIVAAEPGVVRVTSLLQTGSCSNVPDRRRQPK